MLKPSLGLSRYGKVAQCEHVNVLNTLIDDETIKDNINKDTIEIDSEPHDAKVHEDSLPESNESSNDITEDNIESTDLDEGYTSLFISLGNPYDALSDH